MYHKYIYIYTRMYMYYMYIYIYIYTYVLNLRLPGAVACSCPFQLQGRLDLLYSTLLYSTLLFTLLDLCVSSLRRDHANLLCIVPILTDDPRRESSLLYSTIPWYGIVQCSIL